MPEIALNVAADHPSLAGHFPGRPIVPGVVLLDSAIHALEQIPGCVISGIAQVKFLSPVQPGEPLQLSYEPGAEAIRFELASAGRRVASGRFNLARNA